MRTRRTIIVAAFTATTALGLVGPDAIAAPPGGSPVTITETFLTNSGDVASGAFVATAPLCPVGSVNQTRAFKLILAHTCLDGSGTFTITLQGSSSQHKWSFTGGTGAYARIKGSGQWTSNCAATVPCQAVLSGTATL